MLVYCAFASCIWTKSNEWNVRNRDMGVKKKYMMVPLATELKQQPQTEVATTATAATAATTTTRTRKKRVNPLLCKWGFSTKWAIVLVVVVVYSAVFAQHFPFCKYGISKSNWNCTNEWCICFISNWLKQIFVWAKEMFWCFHFYGIVWMDYCGSVWRAKYTFETWHGCFV